MTKNASRSPMRRNRRILALVFPHLASDLHRRRFPSTPQGPLALHERVDNALRLAALDAGAQAFGLSIGQPLAEARALAPDLHAAPLDAARDRADFARILGALMRYSPLVGDGGNGVAFVDIAGCAHLFGGEEKLAQDAVARLRKIGIAARAAVAATPGCAYALAAEADGDRGEAFAAIIPSGAEARALAPLPVAALRLDPREAETLKSLGLKTIGALMARRRTGLSQRFGAALPKRLDEASGALFEPIAPIAPATDFSVATTIPEPVMTIEAALHIAEKLASALEKKLETAGLGARRFDLVFFRLDMSYEKISIALGRPARARAGLLRLFRLKLEKGERPIDPGFGFESFRLSAFATDPLSARQDEAFEKAKGGADTRALEDRLVNHLGADVFRFAPVAAHLPERAEAPASLFAAPPGWGAEPALPRPLALLDPPEPVDAVAQLPDGPPALFRWRRIPYRVARAAGPERLLGDWRRGEDFTRDYYRVEDEAGRRYWLFREGFYEGRAQWFLHGFFA